MMNRRTRAAKHGESRRLLAKAEEFVASARVDLDANRRSAAGLAAVHAGILAADAVSAHVAGAVSAAPNHMEAVGLLREALRARTPPHKLPPVNERQLVGLLNAKNDVEYSGTPITAEQARIMVDQATRLVAWSRSIVRPM